MIHVELPHGGWTPRNDQMPIWAHLESGGVKVDTVAHRRFGKDDIALHWAAVASQQRVGTYWHMLPEAAQARKAIWEAVNPRTGRRRIDDAFPKAIRAATRDQDMLIRMKNGSTWQVLGSDNYNSLVGSPPIGVVFSEWALADPGAYTYIRPILLENGGWAFFIWTPRGRNHATRAFEARENDPSWFTIKMPATKTAVFTPEQLSGELQSLIDEAGSIEEGTAKFNQEYLVDFDASTPGAYYATQMMQAQTEGRVCHVPFDPRFKVSTSWDLGIDDYTSIWFYQRVSPTRVNVIDFYETGDLGLDAIVQECFRNPERLEYKYDFHYCPHDVANRELGAGGRTRRQTLHMLGVRPIRVGVARNPEERVNASRRLIPFSWFDARRCGPGIDHLKQYSKRWNKSLGIWSGVLHDEHSHAADSYGEFAVNAHLPKPRNEKPSGLLPANDRWASMFARDRELNWKTL